MQTKIIEAQGWLLLCPVYVGDMATGEPLIISKYAWLHWWLEVQQFLFDFFIALVYIITREVTPYWLHHVRDIEPFEI